MTCFVRGIVGCSAVVALSFTGTLPSSADDDGSFPSSCEREAVRLIDAAPLFLSATVAGAPFRTLPSGHFVYLCEVKGDFVHIVFPRIGERVDCTVRAETDVCPTGWARKSIRTEIFG